MKIRATQRAHYFKRLRTSSTFRYKTRESNIGSDVTTEHNDIELIEDKLKYEDMITKDLFSEDE
jgi:hypothetical protein